MSSDEARELMKDIEFILREDARDPDERNRLERLRERLAEVDETGHWPPGDALDRAAEPTEPP